MISPELAEQIAAEVEQRGLDEATIAALRTGNPGLHFTYCMDDDINVGRPVVNRPAFNIYLVDGREHCLSLTNDFEVATGFVLAEVVEDDE